MVQAKLTAVALLLLLLSGCTYTVLDVSLQEDALPRQPGKWEITPYYGLKVLLNEEDKGSWETRKDGERDFWEFVPGLIVATNLTEGSVLGVSAAVPVSPSTVLTGKVYLSYALSQAGIVFGAKQVLAQGYFAKSLSGKTLYSSFAVQPTLQGRLSTQIWPEAPKKFALGGDILFLASAYTDPDAVATLGLRLGYKTFKDVYSNRDNIFEYDAYHAGLAINTRLRQKKVTLIPELGLEVSHPGGQGYNHQPAWDLEYYPHIALGVSFGPGR